MTDEHGDESALERRVREVNRARAERGQSLLAPAQVYTDAVWEDDGLTALAKLVALCYANHAGRGDEAWVTYARLLQRTGIGSRSTATKVLTQVVKAGWLEDLGSAPAHRQSIVYRLAIPAFSGAREPPVTDEETGTGCVPVQMWTGTHEGLDRSTFDTGPVHLDPETGTHPVPHSLYSLDSPKDSLPPSPHGDPLPAEAVRPPGGGDASDQQTQESESRALWALTLELLRLRPGEKDWTDRTVLPELSEAVAREGSLLVVAAAARVLYADKATRSPGRLNRGCPDAVWVRARELAGAEKRRQMSQAPRCALHPPNPASGCSGCRADALAAPDEYDEPPPASQEAAARAATTRPGTLRKARKANPCGYPACVDGVMILGGIPRNPCSSCRPEEHAAWRDVQAACDV